MRKPLPFDIGTIHFVGIGGIGMSGIAEVMRNLGYSIRGSDLSENANVKRLRGLGIDIAIGHAGENIADASVVVISSAVKSDNPEVVAAREKLIPVVRRAEMLAELMRLKWCISIAGTHGKTTTTSMIAAVLDAAALDPTVINGGIINAYGTNARLGEGEWMVVEADESDGTFIKLPAMLAVVTNIDPEHMEHYGTFDALRDAFKQFVERTPFYGSAILCIDHPEVQTLVGRISDRRVVTYGMSAQADVRARNVSYTEGIAHFDVEIADRKKNETRRIDGLSLPMPGRHNVVNALAAVSAAMILGLPDEAVRKAFSGFAGVGRRFTKVGEVGGYTIIDDYGHHPVEIAAVLAAAREAYRGRVIAIVQPHRYTRLQNLFEGFSTCFNDADAVVITDVYAAGETPIEGIGGRELAEGIRARGHRDVRHIAGEPELADTVASLAAPGDVVVCMGAGSISAWANALPKRLQGGTA
ncbi:MAG: UDP-N-acetylmuramate--L-alanine ligase [Sphingomonadales bacterium]